MAVGTKGNAWMCDAGENRGRWLTTPALAYSPGIQTIQLWGKYNLGFRDGDSFTVNGTISPGDTDTPNLAQIVDGCTGDAYHDAVRAEYHGKLFTVTSGSLTLVPFEDGEQIAYLDARWVEIIESEQRVTQWTMAGALKPLAAYDGERMVAVAMTVRTS